MSAPPPPSPYAVPPSPGRGRFWLGVLAGGCGVLLLEGLVALVAVALFGVAVASAIQHASSTGSLPGLPALPLPTGLPSGITGLTTASEPCSPRPCIAHGGVTVLVGDVVHDAGPAPGSAGHLVRLDLTFVGTAGTHTISSEEVLLEDSTGQPLLPTTDASAGCGSPPSAQDLAAGQRLGPYPVCYATSDRAGAPLTLLWVNPEDMAIVQLRLP